MVKRKGECNKIREEERTGVVSFLVVVVKSCTASRCRPTADASSSSSSSSSIYLYICIYSCKFVCLRENREGTGRSSFLHFVQFWLIYIKIRLREGEMQQLGFSVMNGRQVLESSRWEQTMLQGVDCARRLHQVRDTVAVDRLDGRQALDGSVVVTGERRRRRRVGQTHAGLPVAADSDGRRQHQKEERNAGSGADADCGLQTTTGSTAAAAASG